MRKSTTSLIRQKEEVKLVVLFLIGSCLIRQKEERCLSNVGLFKPKKITSATLDLEAKIAPTVYNIKCLRNTYFIYSILLNIKQMLVFIFIKKKIVLSFGPPQVRIPVSSLSMTYRNHINLFTTRYVFVQHVTL